MTIGSDLKQRRISLQWLLAAAVLILGFVGVQFHARLAHASPSCPCHVFTGNPTGFSTYDDGTPIELGFHFQPEADGYITGIRFYKDPSMTDTHVGNLWAPDGSLLASGTFTNESASGWQDMTFSTPVQVTDGTLYTASYYAPTGKYVASSGYFDNSTDNYPLLAPSNADILTAGYVGNGVFASGSDKYPDSSYHNTNYWVDVDFRASIDGSPPKVSATVPSNGANDIFTAADLTATFDQSLNSASINASTVKLLDSADNEVAATVSYDVSTKTVRLMPSDPLQQDGTYRVWLHGGSGGITNLDGTPLAADYQWSFTTGTDQCPCSIWNNAAPTGQVITYSGSGGEGETFGTQITSDENGYIQAVRFYKPLRSIVSTHTVHVWSIDGASLGSGTSSHESSFGWQDVKLSSPVPVTEGTSYIISYYSSDDTYVYTNGGLSTEVGSGILHAAANGAWYHAGGNAFPDQDNGTNAQANFWADAVFTTTSSYKEPFSVALAQPLNNSYGVQTDKSLTLKMSNAVDSTTVAGSVTLETDGGQSVTGALTYDDSTHTLKFQPSSPLAASTKYVLSLATSLKDIYGTAAPATTITFTTGSALSTNINQGLGGPVLVLTSSANPYDTYLAEILRAEGINYFAVKDVSQITASTLSQYKLVLLGKSSLSSAQVTTLTNWVQGGGNLIAMQPDKLLTSLLGLTDKHATLSEGYLKVDTTQAPGQGVTAETMQYHGSADEYQAAAGTQTVATLFSDATTTANDPAVTERQVGSGHAAAFVYNLPKSIALTHQGNPAWAGQDRDGNSPIRPNDLFDGGGTDTDYLNLSKAYIPQADEQQRLLVNMMLTMDQSNPMPRFWILPHGLKSALVMTMDDHGTTNGTFYAFNDILNASATDCSVIDWECERGGSLLYTSSGLTPAQADAAADVGFVMGDHVQTSCNNYLSLDDLSTAYTEQLDDFRAKYIDLPNQLFDRTHCYVWSDWDSVSKVDVANGMRINFNYEWYPSAWTSTYTGYLTGSGLAMRFTDASGNMLDDYQGVTDLDYETDPTTATMDTDLDNTINSNGFYGVLGTHYDFSTSTDPMYYQMLISAAKSRNIPMINADQLLTWKDALGSSTFTDVSSSASELDFTVQVAQGGEGMQAMIPDSAGNGALSSLTSGGSDVSYTTNTIKGVKYAVFDAAPGSYAAQYGTTPAPPTDGGSSGGGTGTPGGTGGDSSTTGGSPSTPGSGRTDGSGSSARHTLAAVPAPAASQVTITNPAPFDNTESTPSDKASSTRLSSPVDTDASAETTWWKPVAYAGGGIFVLLLIILCWWLATHRHNDANY